jgi:hypothetical protein
VSLRTPSLDLASELWFITCLLIHIRDRDTCLVHNHHSYFLRGRQLPLLSSRLSSRPEGFYRTSFPVLLQRLPFHLNMAKNLSLSPPVPRHFQSSYGTLSTL